jgi:DNA-binding response OmpR family regulator
MCVSHAYQSRDTDQFCATPEMPFHSGNGSDASSLPGSFFAAPGSRPRILLVEDNALISLILEDDLWDAGFEVVGPCSSSAESLKTLDRKNPVAAILDITLSDGPCVDLARLLRKRRVPFLVFTGQSRSSFLIDAFEGAPWIEKPSSADLIVQTLWEVLPGSAAPAI